MPANQDAGETVFEQAARVFEAWPDAETGRRVLRLHRRGADAGGSVWGTQYHQFPCFLDGGRRVVLNRSLPAGDETTAAVFVLDLTTGEIETPFPVWARVNDVNADTGLACYQTLPEEGGRAGIWDIRRGCDVAELAGEGGWTLNCASLLSDGRRAMAFFHKGQPHRERVVSRHVLFGVDEAPELVLEMDGAFCSHIQQCPTDPELYTYDRWPAPTKDGVDQVLRLRRLDGSMDEVVPLNDEAARPAVTLGSRDHYVWTPDGKWIVSYLCMDPFEFDDPNFNHYPLQWYLSATDWRTGEDLGAAYPEKRWGGHMQVTPDSKHIITSGAPGYDRLLAIDIEGLREGWNERVICGYPKTEESESMLGPFAYPFVLPDCSGVIFSAGWPGADHGVYLAEWPREW